MDSFIWLLVLKYLEMDKMVEQHYGRRTAELVFGFFGRNKERGLKRFELLFHQVNRLLDWTLKSEVFLSIFFLRLSDRPYACSLQL